MNPDRSHEFQRLPGKGRPGGFIAVTRGTSTLWLGPDHLLAINSQGYADEFKRFYYRDIQGFITRHTQRSATITVLLAILIFGFLLGTFATVGVFSAIFFSFAVLGGLGLALNVWKGPSCVTHIRTAVQVEELPSLRRLKNVDRALEMMAQRIEPLQGTLSREEIERGLAGFQARAQTVEAPVRPPPLLAQAGYDGRLHHWLFLTTPIYAVLAGAVSFSRSLVLTAIVSLLSVLPMILCLMALVRQSRDTVNPKARTATWGIAVYFAILFAVSFAASMVMAVRNPDGMVTELDYLRALAELSPLDSPLALGMMIFSTAGGVILGLAGLAALRNSQSQAAGSTALPPAPPPIQVPPAPATETSKNP